MNVLTTLSAVDLVKGFKRRDFSPVEVISALGENIRALNPRLNALVAEALDPALVTAKECEVSIVRGDQRPLLGVPVVIKDLIDTADIRTAYGSKIFARNLPKKDAEVVRRLKAAGAIVLGKSSTHEFAWGFTTDNPHFGSTRNPWDERRIPGGSSGGNAVALASMMTPLAVGTDTGGSIRLPAAYCGVCGLKPTYGAISLEGIFPLAPSLDHVGPMARSPADLRLFSSLFLNLDAKTEPTSLADLKIAVPAETSYATLPAEIADVWRRVTTVLESKGATLVSFIDARILDTTDLFSTIMLAESLRTHQKTGLYPNRIIDYGEDLRIRLKLAEAVTDDELTRAATKRRALRAAFEALFERCDLVLTLCSSASPALVMPPAGNPTEHYRTLREGVLNHTAPQNLAGLPACAVRGGIDSHGLPVGIQFTGPANQEDRVLSAASAFFDATPEIQMRWPDLYNSDRA